MKVAIIGCGSIASRWVRTLTADPRIEIVALFDPDHRAAQHLARRYHLTVPVRTSLHEACASAEVAVNLTPPSVHAAASRTALGEGMHVLSEKPLALTLSEAVDLVERARAAQRMLLVMQNRGQDAGFRAFCNLQRATHTPRMVTADVLVALHHPGFRTHLEYPVTSDLAIHAFDQIRQLVPSPAVEVRCTESAMPSLGAHCALAVCSVTFANGSHFSYRGGYITGRALQTGAGGRWAVTALEMGATWDGAQRVTLDTPCHEQPETHQLDTEVPGYQRCIAAMVDALDGQDHTSCSASENLGSIALLEAALTSCKADGAPTALQGMP